MNSKERVRACIERKPFDRLPVRYYATAPVTAQLLSHFGVETPVALLDCLGVDFRSVAPVYRGPQLQTFTDGSNEGFWGERAGISHQSSGVFQEMVHRPYAAVTSVEQLRGMRKPCREWFDFSTIAAQCRQVSQYAVVANGAGTLDFINGISRLRGPEQVLLDIATEDPVYLQLVEERFEFFYTLTESLLEAAQGMIDLLWCGEDLGSQEGLLISPRSFDRLFAEKYRAYFAQAHKHGVCVAMHSCGAIKAIIPRLIELGLDVLDVVQVSAKGMDLSELKASFGSRLCFCGTLCVQTTLPDGKPEDVRREVEFRQKLFSEGGLILAPTNTIEVGTPLENVLELYRAAGSLRN